MVDRVCMLKVKVLEKLFVFVELMLFLLNRYSDVNSRLVMM